MTVKLLFPDKTPGAKRGAVREKVYALELHSLHAMRPQLSAVSSRSALSGDLALWDQGAERKHHTHRSVGGKRNRLTTAGMLTAGAMSFRGNSRTHGWLQYVRVYGATGALQAFRADFNTAIGFVSPQDFVFGTRWADPDPKSGFTSTQTKLDRGVYTLAIFTRGHVIPRSQGQRDRNITNGSPEFFGGPADWFTVAADSKTAEYAGEVSGREFSVADIIARTALATLDKYTRTPLFLDPDFAQRLMGFRFAPADLVSALHNTLAIRKKGGLDMFRGKGNSGQNRAFTDASMSAAVRSLPATMPWFTENMILGPHDDGTARSVTFHPSILHFHLKALGGRIITDHAKTIKGGA